LLAVAIFSLARINKELGTCSHFF